MPAIQLLREIKRRYEWNGQPGWPGVRTRVIPFASSTPRPHERRVFDGPLLTSVPGGVPSFNHAGASLQMRPRGPPSPWDEASTLAHGVRVRLTGRPRVRSPADDHSAGSEGGQTPRPSPLR